MSTSIYPWGHAKPYNDFSSFFKTIFKERVQKISIDAGFTCPNRNGDKAKGGCTYCNNDTFSPYYTTPKKSVTEQLKEGVAFFSEKYKTQQYLAYFQSYSNTYADIKVLKKLYEEALAVPGVIGLVISTRPDCIDEEKLDYIQELAKGHYILLEFGAESCCNETLERINRAHTFEDTVTALYLAKDRGFHVGIHLLMGLPGESEESMLNCATKISELPFDTLKMHQLQIVTKTKMEQQYAETPEMFNLFTAERYIDFMVNFLERVRPSMIIERFISESPPDMLIAPKWGGMKNYAIVNKIENKLKERNSYQGRLWEEANNKPS